MLDSGPADGPGRRRRAVVPITGHYPSYVTKHHRHAAPRPAAPPATGAFSPP
ncbi:hypothetical protein Ae263Ps1_0970 [Pseudonocardia sp. Ae263_Ps1]|nr:hypothetical protein Ae263Ps1_0970 [Pseudonocardia sp. Ae263_Ps1]OLL96066.1 hypothetical protein Ae356Ps1_5963c [Pseudonocardia sp. Ae356_Ps1]